MANPAAQEIIDRVRTINGDKNATLFSDADILLWINEAVLKLARRAEIGEADWNTVSVIGQAEYDVTGGYLKMKEVYYNGNKIDFITIPKLDRIDAYWRTSPGTRGTPIYWYQLNPDKIALYPVPDTAGLAILARAIIRPVSISTAAAAVPIPYELLGTVVSFCLQRSKEWEEDYAGAAMFSQQFTKEVVEASHDNWNPSSESYPQVRYVGD